MVDKKNSFLGDMLDKKASQGKPPGDALSRKEEPIPSSVFNSINLRLLEQRTQLNRLVDYSEDTVLKLQDISQLLKEMRNPPAVVAKDQEPLAFKSSLDDFFKYNRYVPVKILNVEDFNMGGGGIGRGGKGKIALVLAALAAATVIGAVAIGSYAAAGGDEETEEPAPPDAAPVPVPVPTPEPSTIPGATESPIPESAPDLIGSPPIPTEKPDVVPDPSRLYTETGESRLPGGAPFVPGVDLTPEQMAAIEVGKSWGNSYAPDIEEQYAKQKNPISETEAPPNNTPINDDIPLIPPVPPIGMGGADQLRRRSTGGGGLFSVPTNPELLLNNYKRNDDNGTGPKVLKLKAEEIIFEADKFEFIQRSLFGVPVEPDAKLTDASLVGAPPAAGGGGGAGGGGVDDAAAAGSPPGGAAGAGAAGGGDYAAPPSMATAAGIGTALTGAMGMMGGPIGAIGSVVSAATGAGSAVASAIGSVTGLTSEPATPGMGDGASRPGVSVGGDMDAVKQMIIQHEGIRYEPYQDSLGNWTIGVGHLIGDGSSPGEYAGRRLSEAEVMQLFDQDFAHHLRIAEQTPGWDKANKTGQAAMIDLAFNMGRWWTDWPNTSRALAEGDWEAAARGLEDSRWYDQVGRRAPTIVSMIRAAGDAGEATPTGDTAIASTTAPTDGTKAAKASGSSATPAKSGMLSGAMDYLTNLSKNVTMAIDGMPAKTTSPAVNSVVAVNNVTSPAYRNVNEPLAAIDQMFDKLFDSAIV
jgi:lysozyme